MDSPVVRNRTPSISKNSGSVSKSFKVGVEVFVKLKEGSISQFYLTG